MELLIIIVFGIALIIIINLLRNRGRRNRFYVARKEPLSVERRDPLSVERRDPFYVRRIFTNNEHKLYLCLHKIIKDNERFALFAKVRWQDIFGIESGGALKQSEYSYKQYKGFLRARHVDFLIVDITTCKPKVIIELNDSSHYREERIERDERLKKYCKSAGLPILVIETKPKYDCEEIRTLMNKAYKK